MHLDPCRIGRIVYRLVVWNMDEASSAVHLHITPMPQFELCASCQVSCCADMQTRRLDLRLAPAPLAPASLALPVTVKGAS